MDNSNKWFVVINPTSGNGSGKKQWPKIKSLLSANNFCFEYCLTEYPKHSIKLTQQSICQGFNKLIVIGGDGTTHNVVNAIQTQNYCTPNSIKVGIIPVGTGNDWIKTFGISKNPQKAIETISAGITKQQDIGKIEFINPKQDAIYFNNLAGIGFDGYVVSKVSKYKHLGALAYLVGAIIGLFSFKNFESQIKVNSKHIHTKVLMVVIGICKYSGGGMQLTHTPNPSDGLFDISIAKDLSKFEILKNIFNLFNGKITNHKQVETIKSNYIEVLTKSKNQFIEADGELIGTGDYKASVITKAFTFYA